LKAIRSNEKLTIEDIGKTLYPGQTLWLEEEEYESSICLKTLHKMGKVQVVDSKRHKKLKERTEASNRVNRAARKYRSPPHQTKTQPAEPEPSMVTAEEARRLAEVAAKRAADNAVAQLTAKFTEFMERSNPAPAPVPTGGIEQAVRQAVSQALQSANVSKGSVQGTVSSAPPSVGPEEPIFIPAGIVKQDSEDLSINTTSSKDENIDDAVAALKALKKK